MDRTVSIGSRLALAALVAGTLTCGGDGTSPSVPAKLGISTQPSASADNGVAFGQQPVVQVQDAGGQPISSSGASVTAEVLGGAGVTLNGTLSKVVDAQGAATFSDLSLSGPSGTYTIQFTSSGLASVTSSGIVLGTASITVSTQPPGTALTGEVFDPSEQPAVTLADAGGNPLSGVTVTASVASGSGTLEGGLTATTDAAGVAKFQDLGITGTGAHTLQFAAGSLSATSSTITLSALPAEAATGKWGQVVPWDIVPLHIHLLPTGKILAWGKYEDGTSMTTMQATAPRLWDLASGSPPTSAAVIRADTMLFCSGHSLMADGKLMVSGGHKLDDRGINVTNIFDPSTETWATGLPTMAKGRWYPTVTELPDGRMVTVAGKDETKTTVLIPEIWEGNQWVQLPGASLTLPYYPRDFVAPDGRIFMAGERTTSRWLDVDAAGGGGRGTWANGPAHIWPFNRDYGSAVMYDAGKILYVGGGGDLTWDTPDPKSATPTATAEMIDLQGAQTWQSAGSLPTPRRHLNATVLPDGEVLVTGGVSGGTFNDLATGQRAAEIWDPSTNKWTELASNSITRGYHSVSLLLPDATVLHGGSGNANIPGTSTPYPDEESQEIFQPPYLFKGARPVISDVAPSTFTYGATVQINTPNVGQVAKVRIVRLASVTHAFDQNGRTMPLQFVTSVGGVSVTAPANANLAPPGDYLIFILNRNGVPSAGKFIKVQ